MSTANPTSSTSKVSLRPSRGQARFAFTILFTINILNYADRYVLPAILPKVQADLGLTSLEAGLLGSSFLLVYAFATLPIGVWADRGVRKNIVALCVGIWSVATCLTGFTRNFVQLFNVRAVLGIGEAGYAPASLSLLGDFFSKARRGRVLSYWSSGTLLGAAIGFTLGGLVGDAFGWRWAFYIVGIPGLIAAFLAWRMLEPRRGAFEDEGDDATGEGAANEAEPISEHGKKALTDPNLLDTAGRFNLQLLYYWRHFILAAFVLRRRLQAYCRQGRRHLRRGPGQHRARRNRRWRLAGRLYAAEASRGPPARSNAWFSPRRAAGTAGSLHSQPAALHRCLPHSGYCSQLLHRAAERGDPGCYHAYHARYCRRPFEIGRASCRERV